MLPFGPKYLVMVMMMMRAGVRDVLRRPEDWKGRHSTGGGESLRRSSRDMELRKDGGWLRHWCVLKKGDELRVQKFRQKLQ